MTSRRSFFRRIGQAAAGASISTVAQTPAGFREYAVKSVDKGMATLVDVTVHCNPDKVARLLIAAIQKHGVVLH